MSSTSLTVTCVCSSILKCQIPSAIFDIDFTLGTVMTTNYDVSYIVPGALSGCSESDSLFLSTLECFYSDSPCFSILLNYIKEVYFWNVQSLDGFNIQPLKENNTIFTRFDRNSSISTIVKGIMIEQWNPSYYYETFYHLCSPSYCIYSRKMYSNNILTLIVLLLSMIGGLTISLRLITPHLVTIIIKLYSMLTRQHRDQQTNLNWTRRLILFIQKVIRTLYDAMINLNIFPPHTFGSNIHRLTAKHLGKQTTRLFFVSLILTFVFLVIYTLTQQQIITKDFERPSFDTYNQLIEKYGDELKCSCSSIASTYNHFVHIEPTFHPICSSQFTFVDTITNISMYERRDYRHFISSHFQYLKQLCQISIQSVNNSIQQFLFTLLISKELLSKQDFNEHIESLIEQTKQNAPRSLNSIFFLIRNINFGNAIMSTYGTNFRYTLPLTGNIIGYLNTEAEIYDNNCSCELQINCSSQAYFTNLTSSNKVLLKGLKIGCTPTESLLSSTLECFYDESCLDTLKEYTKLQPLLLTDRFHINTQIGELVSELFIDQWSITKNYSSYYQRCLPSLCSYSYIEKFSIVYIISFILGLQGGLIIVLKWICPKIIRCLVKIKNWRKKSIRTISMAVENNTNPRPRLLKIILSCLLILFLIMILIIFSIFIIHQKNHSILSFLAVPSTTTTTSTLMSTTSNSTITKIVYSVAICQFTLKQISMNRNDFNIDVSSILIADFNTDEKLDLGFKVTENR